MVQSRPYAIVDLSRRRKAQGYVSGRQKSTRQIAAQNVTLSVNLMDI